MSKLKLTFALEGRHQAALPLDRHQLPRRHRREVQLHEVAEAAAAALQPPVERVEAGAEAQHLRVGAAARQERLGEPLHGHDAGVVAAVDLGRLPLVVARQVRDERVVPVAVLHGAPLTRAGVVVGEDDALLSRRALTARRHRGRSVARCSSLEGMDQ